MGLPGRDQDSGHQKQHDGGSPGQGQPLPADEFCQPVGKAVPFGSHRPSLAVAADIVRHLVHRSVPPRRLFVQRREHDGVQVAANLPGVPARDGARRAGIVLANGAHHVVRQLAASLKRVRAHEQLIQ